VTGQPPPGRRYLLLDDGRSLGGGQRFALRLARHLAAAHPAVPMRIACPAGTRLARACAAEGLEHVAVDFPAPTPAHALALAAAAARVRRLLARADGREAVIANAARTQAVLALAAPTLRRRPPVVNLMQEQDSAARPTARWAHRRLGGLVAVGANAARAYSERLPGVAVETANNFLLRSEYELLAARRRPRRVAGVVGVLARLIPEKGVLELVEELAADPRAWDEVRVGGGFQDAAYADRVRARVAQLGLQDRVRLLGEVEDVAGFLDAVDVLAVPSTGREGQPTVVLEALAAGAPVVVRRPVFSSDFEGLPVRPYETPRELAAALRLPAPDPVAVDSLVGRFGPEQALAAIEAAARRDAR
jgi:glycosyltransferase involved in cell wall biosynthesis